MGASGWHYYTDYHDNPNQALARLRQDVFVRGDYFSLMKIVQPAYVPQSIRQLLVDNETEGTHSILDMNACVERDPGHQPDLLNDFGRLIRLDDQASITCLGTTRPRRADIDKSRAELMAYRTSWVGTYLTVFDDQGKPDGLYFTGFSGD